MPSCTPSAPRQNIAAMPAPSAMPPPAITGMLTALTTARTTHERADLVRRRMAAGFGADRDDRIDAGGFRLGGVLGRGGDVQPGHAAILEAREVLLRAALRRDR